MLDCATATENAPCCLQAGYIADEVTNFLKQFDTRFSVQMANQNSSFNADQLPALLNSAAVWAEQVAQSAMEASIALDARQIELAKRVGVRNPELIRLLLTDDFPFPGEVALQKTAIRLGLLGPEALGLTLGYAIIIRPSALSIRILAHECRHVFQFEQHGSMHAFLTEYLQQIVEHGYQNAPMENDARAWESVFQGDEDVACLMPVQRHQHLQPFAPDTNR